MSSSNGHNQQSRNGAGTVAVIPAYNEERFIGSAVIEAGQYADTVIVVDDGSSDATAEIARLAGATVFQPIRSAHTVVGRHAGAGVEGDWWIGQEAQVRTL